MDPSLSVRLREQTREAHRHAERSPFVARLFDGGIDVAGYARLLRSLHPVYEALEAGLDAHADDPRLRAFRISGLERRPGLEQDLEALGGAAWAREVSPVEPALRYGARIRWVSLEAPALLLAHAYVRYLGDLSGGRMLEPAVERVVADAGGDATAFYDFGGLPASPGRVKKEIRAGLDRASVPAAEVVEEARWAFARNREIFDALA
jgi:heme oxygenase